MSKYKYNWRRTTSTANSTQKMSSKEDRFSPFQDVGAEPSWTAWHHGRWSSDPAGAPSQKHRTDLISQRKYQDEASKRLATWIYCLWKSKAYYPSSNSCSAYLIAVANWLNFKQTKECIGNNARIDAYIWMLVENKLRFVWMWTYSEICSSKQGNVITPKMFAGKSQRLLSEQTRVIMI